MLKISITVMLAFCTMRGCQAFYENSENVVELTPENFQDLVLTSEEMWLVEFYATWCAHCRSLAPDYVTAAEALRGIAKVGAVNMNLELPAHKSLSTKYNITGFPTIKVFGGDKDNPEPFQAERSPKGLAGAVLQAARNKVKACLDGSYKKPSASPAVSQIVDERSLTSKCEHSELCVLAVLPLLSECQTECRKGYVGVLKDISREFRGYSWGWVWFETGSQPELEKALEVTGLGHPAMVVVNYRELKSTVYKGGFSEEGLREFFREVAEGKGATTDLKVTELPKIHSVEPWNENLEKVQLDEGDVKDEL